MDKHNPYWIPGGPWYNTSICKKYMEQCLNNLLEMQELTYIISCGLLMHMININHNIFMMVASLVVMHYSQIQKYKH